MTNPVLRRILYVEDDEDIGTVAKLALESVGGFTVLVCPSGALALALAPEFDPDLILLDVMMPEMDGPTTLAELRKIDGFAGKPVIFMTAKVMRDEVENYKTMGAVEVIPKPFDPMRLPGRILEIWTALNG